MSKQLFWPLTLIVMGLIFLFSDMGILPRDFWNLWPLILLIVGLGGLLTSDRLEWMGKTKKVTAPAKTKKTKSSARKKR